MHRFEQVSDGHSAQPIAGGGARVLSIDRCPPSDRGIERVLSATKNRALDRIVLSKEGFVGIGVATRAFRGNGTAEMIYRARFNHLSFAEAAGPSGAVAFSGRHMMTLFGAQKCPRIPG